jgi:hypothetical protein
LVRLEAVQQMTVLQDETAPRQHLSTLPMVAAVVVVRITALVSLD